MVFVLPYENFLNSCKIIWEALLIDTQSIVRILPRDY